MKEQLSRKDIMMGYAARIFSLGAGLITLPLVLRHLSENEIAFNYLLTTILSIVALFDIGFSPQFSRNFAYLFGGAQEILVVGVPSKNDGIINYTLLGDLINAAKKLYRYIALGVFVFLITLGTLYVYKFTDGFTLIDNILPMWSLFVISVVIDFYFRYYSPMLLGKGMISELNFIEIIASSSKIIVLSGLLLSGFGLWSIVISSFLRVLIARMLSYYYFYDEEMRSGLKNIKQQLKESKAVIKKLWYNARRSMIVSIATYASTQMSLFYTGLFLTKSDMASYGLFLQLMNAISALSMSVNESSTPIYSMLRTSGKTTELQHNVYFTMGVFYYIYIAGIVGFLLLGQPILNLIKSNARLPDSSVMAIYIIYKFLENQHVVCTCFLVSQNRIVDFESALIIGLSNLIALSLVVSLTDFGLQGLVFVQFFVPLCYPNWKWPNEVCREFGINYITLISSSLLQPIRRIKLHQ